MELLSRGRIRGGLGLLLNQVAVRFAGLRSLSLLACSRLAPLALLPGCLVVFNDYPLAESNEGGSGGAAIAGRSMGGESMSMPVAGGGSGATSGTGGSTGDVGGTADVGGTPSSGGGGSANQAGGNPDQMGDAGAPSQGNPNPNLIDDFEDGDDLIIEQQGRKGSWFVSNDGSGPQMPEDGADALPSAFMLARADSTRGMHTWGGPFRDWGAIIGTELASTDGEAAAYDLSAYQGIRLWVRTNVMSPGSAKSVRLNLPTPATSPGGGCTICDDHFGFAIPLTTKWAQVEVPFANLRQEGFGRPQRMRADLTGVTSLEFQFPENVSFDLWLDDIELY